MLASASCPSPVFTLRFTAKLNGFLCLSYNFLCQRWEGGAGLAFQGSGTPVKSRGIILCVACMPVRLLSGQRRYQLLLSPS